MKKYFCTNCGERLIKETKKCPYCEKNVIPKRHPIRDVLYDNIKDDLKGKTKDTFFDIITNFIKSHLYGSIVTLTVIGSIAVNIVSNQVNSPSITNEKPAFNPIIYKEIKKVEIKDSKEFIDVFSRAVATGDEETIKAISYENHYPENYKKFYSETNTWILGDGNGGTIPNYNFLDYPNLFKNIGKYYVGEMHSISIYSEQPLEEVDENFVSYFEDTKNIVLNGRAVVEGNMILSYCLPEKNCVYQIEYGGYNVQPDYDLATFYTIIKEDGN